MSTKLEAAKGEVNELYSDAKAMTSAVQDEILATRSDIAKLKARVRTVLKAPIDRFFSPPTVSPDEFTATLKRWGIDTNAEENLRLNKLRLVDTGRIAAASTYAAARVSHDEANTALRAATKQHETDRRTAEVRDRLAAIFSEGSWLALPELKRENYQSPWRRMLSPAYREVIRVLTQYRAEASASYFYDVIGLESREQAYEDLRGRVQSTAVDVEKAKRDHAAHEILRQSWIADGEFKAMHLVPIADYLSDQDPIPKKVLDAIAADVPDIKEAAEQSAKYQAQIIILQRQLVSLMDVLPKTQAWLKAIDPIRTKLGRLRSGDRSFKGVDLRGPRASLSTAKSQTHTYVKNLQHQRSESSRLGYATTPSTYVSHTTQDTSCSDFWLLFWLMETNQNMSVPGPSGLLDTQASDPGASALSALGLVDDVPSGQSSATSLFDNAPTFDTSSLDSALSGFEDAIQTSCATTTSSCGSSTGSSCGSSSSPSSSCSSSSSSSCSSSSSSSCSSSSGSSCGGGGGGD